MRIVIKVDGWNGADDIVVRVSREDGEDGDGSARVAVESGVVAANAGAAPAGGVDFAGATLSAARVPTDAEVRAADFWAEAEPAVTDAGPAPDFSADDRP